MFENITQLPPSATAEMDVIAQSIHQITHSEDMTVPEKVSALRALAEHMQSVCFQAERAHATLMEG